MSILASDISDRHDSNSNLQAGIGVALAYSVAPGWNVEVAAARQSYQSYFTSFELQSSPSGISLPVPVTRIERFTVVPIDLVVHRHFLRDRRVSPYLSAGLRYVDAPNDPDDGPGAPTVGPFAPVRTGFGFSNRTSAQAGVGLNWRLTPGAALRLELTRVLRNESAPFDPLNRATLGISWRL